MNEEKCMYRHLTFQRENETSESLNNWSKPAIKYNEKAQFMKLWMVTLRGERDTSSVPNRYRTV